MYVSKRPPFTAEILFESIRTDERYVFVREREREMKEMRKREREDSFIEWNEITDKKENEGEARRQKEERRRERGEKE